jgi:L-malate glycosyltransferase
MLNEYSREMTKVLFIVNGYPDQKSSANIFVKIQARSLKDRGIDVGVMVVDIRSIRRLRRHGIHKEIIDEIPVWYISFPWGGFFPALAQSLYNFLGEIAYKRIKTEFGTPDILHSHFGGCGIIGAGIKKIYNIPLVITEHSSLMLAHAKNYQHKKRVLKAYGICDRLIAVSTNLAGDIKKLGFENVSVIPNIIPHYYFAGTSRKTETTKKQFISVGYLLPNKRFDLLISAFKRLCKIKDDITLVIAGDGPLYKDLMTVIRSNKLEDKISLLGHVKNTTLPELYRESVCFVLPSEYETFGVVYAEAIASGIPVIATDCGGPDDIVDKSNGLIIEKDNEGALFDAMLYMYNNYLNYNPETLIGDCLKKFGEESVTNRILNIYKEVLGRLD